MRVWKVSTQISKPNSSDQITKLTKDQQINRVKVELFDEQGQPLQASICWRRWQLSMRRTLVWNINRHSISVVNRTEQGAECYYFISLCVVSLLNRRWLIDWPEHDVGSKSVEITDSLLTINGSRCSFVVWIMLVNNAIRLYDSWRDDSRHQTAQAKQLQCR